jgi:hypothetical protein
MYEGVFESNEAKMLVWYVVLALGIIIGCKVQCSKSKQNARLSFLLTLCPRVFAVIIMNFDTSGLEVKEHLLPKHLLSM